MAERVTDLCSYCSAPVYCEGLCEDCYEEPFTCGGCGDVFDRAPEMGDLCNRCAEET